MPESEDLAAARACLADAEARLESAEGLVRLDEGLGRLNDVMEAGDRAEARTAGNLAASYAGRCYERVRKELERDPQIPEPKLEHYFKLVLAFVSTIVRLVLVPKKHARLSQQVTAMAEKHAVEQHAEATESKEDA